MDDLISRQAAIDALDAVCDRECEYSKQQRSVMCGACRLGSAFDVIDELPSAQPEQQWIPWTSGRFPEESGTYTVTAYDGATNRVTYAKYQKRLKRWELTGARAYWRVLAWCPPPEPYKEDDNEG